MLLLLLFRVVAVVASTLFLALDCGHPLSLSLSLSLFLFQCERCFSFPPLLISQAPCLFLAHLLTCPLKAPLLSRIPPPSLPSSCFSSPTACQNLVVLKSKRWNKAPNLSSKSIALSIL